jgi:cytochrome bd ubiquinol oxidase subunit II
MTDSAISVLPSIWMAILCFNITLYVLLDGFSLGVGILFPWAHKEDDRSLMMASVAPVWDGNQTWLVGGGAALFAAFPKAFNLLGTVLYVPLMIMLLALVFRGVAFEFRFKAARPQVWSLAFTVGSTVAALCQGMILGTFVQGFQFDGLQLLAGPLGFISPFSIVTGIGVVLAYALLGSSWLIYKSEGTLQKWARERARLLLPLVLLTIALVCLWTPIAIPEIRSRWFDWPNPILLSPIPIWTGVIAFVLWRLLRSDKWHDALPFACCIGLYLMTLVGLAVSLWPFIVPRSFAYWQVAAPDDSLMFTLVGVLLIVPVILVYTAHAYYVFRGKVRLEDAYH